MIGGWFYRAQPLNRRLQILLEAERQLDEQPQEVKQRGMQRALAAAKREQHAGMANSTASVTTHSARVVPLSAAVASQRLGDDSDAAPYSGVFSKGGWLHALRPAYVATAVLVVAGFSAAAIGINEYRKARQPAPVIEQFEEPAPLERIQHPQRAKKPQADEAEHEKALDPSELPKVVPDVARQQAPARALKSKDLARELNLLQPARTAVAQGRHAQALAVIAQHQAQFPKTQLRQEREALRIRALWGTGRRGAARQAARAFRKQYPRSALLSWMKPELEPDSED